MSYKCPRSRAGLSGSRAGMPAARRRELRRVLDC